MENDGLLCESEVFQIRNYWSGLLLLSPTQGIIGGTSWDGMKSIMNEVWELKLKVAYEFKFMSEEHCKDPKEKC